jgi:AcrR family transcriptional regulator
MTTNGQLGQKRLKRDARKEAILQGAAKAFVKNGFDATSLDDIAEAAHVSRALLYRHFDTKKDIYVAILEGNEEPPKLADAANPSTGTNRVNRLIDIAQADPDRFILLFRHAAREPEFQEFTKKREALRVSYAIEMLKPYISSPKQRRFIAKLLSDTIISILLSWTDAGCPDIEKMPAVLRDVQGAIVGIFSNEESKNG